MILLLIWKQNKSFAFILILSLFFHLNRQCLSPCQLVNLSARLLVNSLKIKIFAKTVNHLVACVETLDLQGFQFLIYTKNHLVIVLMVLLRKQFISDNIVSISLRRWKKLNTDLTEDTDLTFSLIFFLDQYSLDLFRDFRGFASACGTPYSLANEHQPPLVLPRRGEAGYIEC